MKNFINKWYPLALILFVATALRINMAINRGTRWFDESFSVHFSTIPSWIDTLKYWTWEINPPFYHLFLRFYLAFVDKSNELLVRLPSIIFSLITIALFYIFAQKIFSKRAAILSSLFLTFSTTHIRFSTEVRMYSLFVMLVMISFLIYHKIIFERNNNKLLWFFYCLTTLLLLFTHLSAPAIILIQLATMIYAKTDKIFSKKWLVSLVIATSLWAIWFIPSIISKINPALASAWFLNNGEFTFFTITNPIVMAFMDFSPGNHFFTTILTLSIPFVAYLFYKKTKNSAGELKNYIFLICIWAMFPIICAALGGIFWPKYLLPAYLGLFLLVAYTIDIYTSDSKKKFLLATTLVISIMLPPAINTSNGTIFTWRPFVEYIEKKETPNSMSLIFFAEAESFKEYYHGTQPVTGIYTRQDNFSIDERVVKYSWNKHDISDEDARDWLFEKISENKANKIFFIYTGGFYNKYDQILFKEGWVLKNTIESPGRMPYMLMEIDAPNPINYNK